MKHNLSDLYSYKFFRGRDKYHWRAPIVCGSLNYIFLGDKIRTAIDVGAATGDLVQGFIGCGIDAYGIEGADACLLYLACPKDRMIIHDLRDPLDLTQWAWARFDLCTCWEVAEHLEEQYADTFVDNLCGLSDRIVMSACPPNPAGRVSGGSVGHFNEQPYDYWIKKFRDRGYPFNAHLVERFRSCVYGFRGKYGIKAFYDNCLVFIKG